MKKILYLLLLLLVIFTGCAQKQEFRRISAEEFVSKMKAGWLGQMAGVGWGGPTEFGHVGTIIPAEDVPPWTPDMLNQQYQDDIYVEMTFVKTLEDYGFDVSIRQAGIDFANSRYMLWHANRAGRENLRSGIAPPFSGHPKYNEHADDIDYQIEADYSGLISPGMLQSVIKLGEKFGHLMNYGDGMYGGQFVGGMYAEAFFETDVNKIIEAGLRCIPAESQYAEAVKDVINWHKQFPNDWEKTWNLVMEKYMKNPEYRKFSCMTDNDFSIDAKLNGAFIVIGLLYGDGEMDSTIIHAMRCGEDSDCNPSNAGGILATALGLENLPEKFKTGIDDSTKFSFTSYDFPTLVAVCEKLARQAILRAGGKIEKDDKGEEYFLIPVQSIQLAPLEQSWAAAEITGDVHFTDDEMSMILLKTRKAEEFVNRWQTAGPFFKKGKTGEELFDVKFKPEIDPNYSDWKDMPVGTDGFDSKQIELIDFYKTENCAAYLRTNIWSDKAQKVIFEIGSDDGIKVWLNNKIVHENNVSRGHLFGEDKVETELKNGWNSILMKVTQGVGGWGASLVITDLEGESLKGLKYKL